MNTKTQLKRREVVEMLLLKLGISSSKLGFLYLTTMITLAWQDRETDPHPFRVYGNRMAKEANLFSGHIYTNMKYAVEEAWFRGNFKLMETIFGYSLMSLITRAPTPNQFMHGIVTALLALESNNADIPAFFKYIEQDVYLLKELSAFHEDKRD